MELAWHQRYPLLAIGAYSEERGGYVRVIDTSLGRDKYFPNSRYYRSTNFLFGGTHYTCTIHYAQIEYIFYNHVYISLTTYCYELGNKENLLLSTQSQSVPVATLKKIGTKKHGFC